MRGKWKMAVGLGMHELKIASFEHYLGVTVCMILCIVRKSESKNLTVFPTTGDVLPNYVHVMRLSHLNI